MQATTARALKEQRRLQRRSAGRAPNARMAFLRGFLKHPVMVGSVIPSSRRLIDKMLAPVNWDECRLFVEYGPGVGTFTRPILERMAVDATLVTIDTNSEFTDYLRASIDDERLMAVTGSAADIEKILADRGFGDQKLYDALTEMRFDATMPDGRQHTVDGFLTVDDKKMTELPDAVVGELHRTGVLGLIHLHWVSMGNMRRLVDWHVERGAAAPAAEDAPAAAAMPTTAMPAEPVKLVT